MATIQITSDVSKELYELLVGLTAFVARLKPALADGFSAGDLPALISAGMALAPALNGIEKCKDEYAENPGAFLRAASIGLSEMANVLKK